MPEANPAMPPIVDPVGLPPKMPVVPVVPVVPSIPPEISGSPEYGPPEIPGAPVHSICEPFNPSLGMGRPFTHPQGGVYPPLGASHVSPVTGLW